MNVGEPGSVSDRDQGDRHLGPTTRRQEQSLGSETWGEWMERRIDLKEGKGTEEGLGTPSARRQDLGSEVRLKMIDLPYPEIAAVLWGEPLKRTCQPGHSHTMGEVGAGTCKR